MTQKQKVLKVLRKGSTTIAELNRALNFQCNYPVCIIRDLRRAGHVIQDRRVKTAKSWHNVYTLIE